MKRLALSVVALSLLSVPAPAQDWASVAGKVEKSLVALSTNGRLMCSGFVIDSQRDFVQTAAHCVEGRDVAVDGVPATVVAYDQATDLAVLHAPTSKPALKPSKRALKKGMPVMSVGHAYGFEQVTVRPGYVSSLENDLPGFGYDYLAVVPALVGGQSGGPIVDRDGNVVAINQVGDDYTGWGQTIKKVLSVVGRFWAGK